MSDQGINADSSFALLERAKAGDAEALDALLRRYLPRLRHWASGRLPRSARGALDTEDVIQDTLVRALKRFQTFENRGEGALQAYLRQALLNRLTDLYRHAAHQPERDALSTSVESEDASPLEHAVGAEMVQRYEDALRRLKPEDREVIVLRIELGNDYQQIAAACGWRGPAHARVAVSRALARLAREMSVGAQG